MDPIEHRAATNRAIADDPSSELAADFSETARILFAASSSRPLAQVVELAAITIEGCDFAGLFLLEKDAVTSPVHTDPIVDEIDALQHETGDGPCLDAITQRLLFYAEDLAADPRWPVSGLRRARQRYGASWRSR